MTIGVLSTCRYDYTYVLSKWWLEMERKKERKKERQAPEANEKMKNELP